MNDEGELRYTPNPSAIAIHDSAYKIKAICGPVGSGKTSVACWEFFLLCHDSKVPVRGVVIRESYRELQDSTRKTFFEWFGEFAEYKEKNETALLTIPGADGKVRTHELMFRACRKESDATKFLSTEFAFAWLEEICPVYTSKGVMGQGLPMGVFDVAKMRIRQKHAPRLEIVLTFNPPNTRHWVYKEIFVKTPAELDRKGYALFRQPAYENKENLPTNYYEELTETLSPDLARRFVQGEVVTMYEGERVFPEAKDNWHIVEHVDPLPGLPLILGQDYGLCYDDKTEVLTDKGWLFFRDVPDDARFATLNPETREVSYAFADKRVAEPYSGEMLEWATAAVNICVTADHWVPWVDDHDEKRAVRWAQAKQLAQRRGSHHCVLVTGQWRAPAFDPQATYGPLGWDALTFCEFMGWYLSEGSCDGTYRVNVAQQERHLKLEQSLDATGLTWRRAATSYRISHRGLVAYLSQFGKAKEKFVPDEIKQFPSWLIRRFIDSYTLGDGNRRVRANGAEEHTVYTTSARMKNDMQELALKAGWHSSVRGMKPQRSYIQEASGVRAIRGTGGYNITFKKRASEARLLPNKLRRFHYEGMVYCVRVPFHTLYVRRNGKPSWNGNTPCCLITQITPGGQWRWLRELQLWNKGMRAFVEFLVPMLKNEFFGYQVQTIWQDPQGGNMRVQTDETTCADILRAAGFNVQDGHNNWALRKEVMKQRLEIAPNGEPGVLVSRYGCPMAAEGLLGAYRYAKTADGLVASVPIKNEASHLQDAAQMIAVGEFSVMSGLAKMEEIKQKVRLRPVHNPLASNRAPRSNALGWMGR